MKISPQTIFDAQIEKFKDLKAQYDNIEEKKRNFNYDEQLSILQNNMQDSIEEISKSEKLSDEIKESTIEAIKGEFQKKKEKLDKEMNGFNDELGLIDLERAELREDPKYIEAMTIRRKRLQAGENAEQLKQKRNDAKADYNRSKTSYEEAKLVMEQKKKEMDKAEANFMDSENAYNESLGMKEAEYKSYTKEIEKVLTMEEIKDRIRSSVLYFVENPVTIDISKISGISISKFLKSAIYRKTGLSAQGCPMTKIGDDILQIDDVKIPEETESGDILTVFCCYGNGEECEIKVEIIGEKSDQGEAEHLKTMLAEPQQTAPKEKKEDLELLEALEGIKKYFINLDADDDNYFLTMMQETSKEKKHPSNEFGVVLRDLAIIYKGYNQKKEVLDLIVYASRLLPHSTMPKLIACARDKSAENGKKHAVFNETYQTIISLRHDNIKLTGRERKENELTIVSCICTAFGFSIGRDVKISDTTKTPFLSAGAPGTGKAKRKWN